MKALVLFDVDGTLLVTGGATTRCIWRAAEATFGRPLDRCKLTAGLLDPQLFLSITSHCGIPDGPAQLQKYRSLYLIELEAELRRTAQHVKLMPGIASLLDALSQTPDDITLGILTGNFREATMLKLRAANLDPSRFPVGAFAEDGAERRDLVAAALRQFAQIAGKRASPDQAIIVGDTPRDIATARATGCRVLAVATGTYSLDQLRAENPDVAVNDLSDPAPLHALIELAHHSRHI